MSYQEDVTSKECHLHLIKYILESRILDTPEYIHTYVLVSQRNMSVCVGMSYRWPSQFLSIFKFYGTLFFTIFHHGTATGWSVLKMSQKVLLPVIWKEETYQGLFCLITITCLLSYELISHRDHCRSQRS